jgi:hypothetical protein
MAHGALSDPLGAMHDITQTSQWEQSFETLSLADTADQLCAEDLEALGEAAWWLRRLAECTSARERAVAAYVADGNPRRAAMVALRLFYTSSVRGEDAIATGWLRRASRLLEELPEGVEHGHLHVARTRVARAHGDIEAELDDARTAIALGEHLLANRGRCLRVRARADRRAVADRMGNTTHGGGFEDGTSGR